jgi:hypothetical protein
MIIAKTIAATNSIASSAHCVRNSSTHTLAQTSKALAHESNANAGRQIDDILKSKRNASTAEKESLLRTPVLRRKKG